MMRFIQIELWHVLSIQPELSTTQIVENNLNAFYVHIATIREGTQKYDNCFTEAKGDSIPIRDTGTPIPLSSPSAGQAASFLM